MPITPGVLGTQDVTLPMTVGVVLANAVLTADYYLFDYAILGRMTSRIIKKWSVDRVTHYIMNMPMETTEWE